MQRAVVLLYSDTAASYAGKPKRGLDASEPNV